MLYRMSQLSGKSAVLDSTEVIIKGTIHVKINKTKKILEVIVLGKFEMDI